MYEEKASNYCHCRLCQKAIGAPVAVFTWVPTENFKFSKGQPKRYASSDKGDRLFCGDCGTPVGFDTKGPVIGVTVPTLDNPECFAPQQHIFVSSRQPWFKDNDGLPHLKEGPDSDSI
ncbi:hypothetical protein WJX84_005799 [Apatococcus fuscideae]|uniref:CENP-V/GFA domain-containing protein n=1 Tax=Apatococcus fuscideae TaxID=2026836 RepID=A0AAW1T7F9_9CHLO